MFIFVCLVISFFLYINVSIVPLGPFNALSRVCRLSRIVYYYLLVLYPLVVLSENRIQAAAEATWCLGHGGVCTHFKYCQYFRCD